MRVSLFLYPLVLTLALARTAYTQQIQIPQGILRGDTRTNRDGGLYYSFKNIPYARPPIGELRFKAPQPAGGWTGVRDATQDVPQCVQIYGMAGQEDCLYLNVYTSKLPDGVVSPKAVMVFIHGGAFMLGSSQESGMGAQFLMTEDVVVVTINYRVGVFGFITLDDPNLGITGNAALKDQVLALQWVRDNIKYFGGDPNNVLIFGESAGAMSVHLHLLSPMSRGLFHKAIAQSGVGISPLVFNNVRNTAVTVAEKIGIPTGDWSKMLSLLQQASVESLVYAELASNVDHWLLSIPKVEIASNGPTFLERQPMDIIRSGDFNQVPFMSGFNELEGTLLFFEVNDDGVSPFVPDLTRFIPLDLEIEPGSVAERDIVQRLKDFYYGGGEPSRDTVFIDMKLYGDFAFVFPHYRASIEQLKSALNSIYLYYFTAVTELEGGSGLAGHGAELAYLWYTGRVLEEGSDADRVSRNMVSRWTNFAIYGDPTPKHFYYTWKPVQGNQSNYLHIAREGSFPQVNVLPSVIQFWSDIYKQYYPN